MTNDDSRLNDLFRRYRASCPDVEPSVAFMTGLWQKIDARHSFWFVFQRLARTTATACAGLCLLLVVLNFISAPQTHLSTATYTDALLADHSAENTYYTEAIRSTAPADETRQAPRH